MSVYDKIFPPRVLTLPNGKQVSKPRSRAPLAAVILVAMTALSVEVTGFDMERSRQPDQGVLCHSGRHDPARVGLYAPDLAAPV